MYGNYVGLRADDLTNTISRNEKRGIDDPVISVGSSSNEIVEPLSPDDFIQRNINVTNRTGQTVFSPEYKLYNRHQYTLSRYLALKYFLTDKEKSMHLPVGKAISESEFDFFQKSRLNS